MHAVKGFCVTGLGLWEGLQLTSSHKSIGEPAGHAAQQSHCNPKWQRQEAPVQRTFRYCIRPLCSGCMALPDSHICMANVQEDEVSDIPER